MKKTVGVVVALVVVAITTGISFRFFAARPVSAQTDVSERTSKVVQGKIDAIKAAERLPAGRPRTSIDVSEPELESYVLYGMKDDIPGRVEFIDVHLMQGVVAADTRMTFPPDATGNVIADALISGTHSFFLKGKLAATAGQGRFELTEVKVD